MPRLKTTEFVSQLQRHEAPKEEPEKLVKEHSLIPRKERTLGAPVQLRPGLSEEYANPVSGRENWWRKTIRETPNPGTYDIQEQDTFLLDLERRQNTYRFQSDGRTLDPQPQIGKGAYLLPGAYSYQDLKDMVAKENKRTYAFKDTSRSVRDVMNFGRKDKDINVAPTEYDTANYLACSADKQPSKHSVFKSQTQRFPTIQFKPKTGPPPGGYQYDPPKALFTVSSSFKSKTPRFSTSHTKTPGPGAYEKTYKPHSATVTEMGKHFGLFFSPQYNSLLGNC